MTCYFCGKVVRVGHGSLSGLLRSDYAGSASASGWSCSESRDHKHHVGPDLTDLDVQQIEEWLDAGA